MDGCNFKMPKEKNCVAIVTGASTGIGLEISRTLAKHGYNIAITARNAKNLSDIITEPVFRNVSVLPIELELLSEKSINGAIQKVNSEFGRVDVLVNNAAIALVKPAVDVTWDDWDTVVNANLKGSYFLSSQFAKLCVNSKQSGTIVNIASTHGLLGFAGRSVYGISKGGMVQMTRMLAIEWAENKIRVNTVSPGTVMTDSRERSLDKEAQDNMLKRIPYGRFPEEKDIAEAVLFLIKAQNVTGQNIVVDGGMSVT
jgi:NAD(P)-dependent dehydrogenase (short-subunit alcohol dehydrogenase family)